MLVMSGHADRPRRSIYKSYRADGPALKRIRERAHLTLHELEEKSGVSFTTISRIENGKSKSPQFRTLRSLADALGVSVDALVIYDYPAPTVTEPDERQVAEEHREYDPRDE
jgi:transcriptional regulator with XRE-family HTH domain